MYLHTAVAKGRDTHKGKQQAHTLALYSHLINNNDVNSHAIGLITLLDAADSILESALTVKLHTSTNGV